jgi:hypothetical protein
MSTIAEVRYRDYVGPWTIAIEFLRIEFAGDDKREYKHQWHELDYRDSDLKLRQKEELESKLQDLQNSVETLRNGYEELRRECYFILNWFNKELKAQRDEAFEIFNAEYKKKLELEKEVKDFEVYDDIHTSKRKKDQFLTENGFKLVSSHFQDGNDITVEKWMKD